MYPSVNPLELAWKYLSQTFFLLSWDLTDGYRWSIVTVVIWYLYCLESKYIRVGRMRTGFLTFETFYAISPTLFYCIDFLYSAIVVEISNSCFMYIFRSNFKMFPLWRIDRILLQNTIPILCFDIQIKLNSKDYTRIFKHSLGTLLLDEWIFSRSQIKTAQ